MRNRKYKISQSLSHGQILARVKRQMFRQQSYQKAQENLLYLNNSFNNNIQCQQIFIDLSKGKKKKIRSDQLKMMYQLFCENKANMCIFEKLADEELKRINVEKGIRDSSMNKWTKDTKGIMEVIQEEQAESPRQILTNKNLRSDENNQRTQHENQPDASRNSSTSRIDQSSCQKSERSSIFQRASLNYEIDEDTKELEFLTKRIYCRLIEKILVKIAFYTMNTKFLDCLAVNMLQISRNLETMIRRLSQIKDLRLLQQTILKAYKENMEVQDKIFQILVDKGYIMSIDEFYRINGIDATHQEVYERKSDDELKNRYKLTLKDKIMRSKEKKQMDNAVKKDHIGRTNQQIHEKYMSCVSQIKKILGDDENEIIAKKTPQKKQPSFSKTQPLPRKSNTPSKKPSRFASGFGIGKTIEDKQIVSPLDSQVTQSQNSIGLTHSSKQKINYKPRFSSFSPEFTKIIKQSESAQKIQRGSVLSEKFMEFNQLERGQRKQSKVHFQAESSEGEKRVKKELKKSTILFFCTAAINKLLRLYEARNTDHYSIDSFLSDTMGLPAQLRQTLKEELLKLQNIYSTTHERVSVKKSSLNLSQKSSDNSSGRLNKQNTEEYKFTKRQNSSRSFNSSNKLHFSSHKALKSYHNSKQETKSPHEKKNQLKESSVQEDQIIQKKDAKEEQTQFKQSSRQNSLIKLSNDRIQRVRTSQKIRSENSSIFTKFGVKNLQHTAQNSTIPFKNQKNKRIPYMVKRQKLQTDSINAKANQDAKNQEVFELNNPKMVQYPKILKKAYQNNTESTKINYFNQKTLQEVVRDQTLTSSVSKKKRIHEQKGRSLHKMATNYEKKIPKNLQNQRPDMFITFFPRWMDRTVHLNSHQENGPKFYERNNKISTTIYESCFSKKSWGELKYFSLGV